MAINVNSFIAIQHYFILSFISVICRQFTRYQGYQDSIIFIFPLLLAIWDGSEQKYRWKKEAVSLHILSQTYIEYTIQRKCKELLPSIPKYGTSWEMQFFFLLSNWSVDSLQLNYSSIHTIIIFSLRENQMEPWWWIIVSTLTPKHIGCSRGFGPPPKTTWF